MGEKTNYTVFVDQIGRTVVGKLKSETESHFVVDNPVIIHVQPTQNGQLNVQAFPYLFMEFIDPENRDKNEWTFNKNNTVASNVVLDRKLINQYEAINKVQKPEEPEVIRLFDK